MFVLLRKLQLRLELSRAKHRSLAGHARMSRRFARLVRFYEYDEAQLFQVDGAPAALIERRRAGFMRLAGLYAGRYQATQRLTQDVQAAISDLQFTASYRVPGRE